MSATAEPIAPGSFAEVADMLAGAGRDGAAVAIAGAGTKPWAPPAPAAGRELRCLRTRSLDRILAHDPGDMTASLQAGVPLASAQAAFAEAGQMLALDPPLGLDALASPTAAGARDGSAGGDGLPATATIGGILASGDSGPLAHRYGGPRDLVVGATFALADGTIAKSGGTVIKNVAGYDLAKLLCGSHGTLGVILSVNVRLHHRHPAVTVRGGAGEVDLLAAAARALARAPAELEALDLAWRGDAGELLARVAGPQASVRARRLVTMMREAGLDAVAESDDPDGPWVRQRAGQRSSERAVLHVALPPSRLGALIAVARSARADLVARAGLGRAWLAVDPGRVAELRAGMPAGAHAVLHDCPPERRSEIPEPWGETPPAALGLMRALKDRFDPGATCNPGAFVGGI